MATGSATKFNSIPDGPQRYKDNHDLFACGPGGAGEIWEGKNMMSLILKYVFLGFCLGVLIGCLMISLYYEYQNKKQRLEIIYSYGGKAQFHAQHIPLPKLDGDSVVRKMKMKGWEGQDASHQFTVYLHSR